MIGKWAEEIGAVLKMIPEDMTKWRSRRYVRSWTRLGVPLEWLKDLAASKIAMEGTPTMTGFGWFNEAVIDHWQRERDDDQAVDGLKAAVAKLANKPRLVPPTRQPGPYAEVDAAWVQELRAYIEGGRRGADPGSREEYRARAAGGGPVSGSAAPGEPSAAVRAWEAAQTKWQQSGCYGAPPRFTDYQARHAA